MTLKIHLINHASVVIELGEVKLLTDPWFFGTCFESGWGLRYDNPRAFDTAADCTHLWVSHFHGDHFHMPTLRKLAEVNPSIVVLGNHSFNFQLDKAIQRAGFKNVQPIYERVEYRLDDHVRVTRYPTTGIDNMLYVRFDDVRLLNYNDCNLPARARSKLAAKIGSIDVLLNNYNHAGKYLEHPLPGPTELIEQLKAAFVESSRAFGPKHIVPFASYHYYRALESQEQNASIMKSADLLPLDDRIVQFDVGDTLEFDADMNCRRVPCRGGVTCNKMDVLVRDKRVELAELQRAFRFYAQRIRRSFLGLTFWVPPLIIRIVDLDVVVSAHLRRGLRAWEGNPDDYHIECTSQALSKWFDTMYGTDSFWVGGHFEIHQSHVVPLRWQMLLGLLTENKLDLSSLLRMLVTPQGLRFLFNRREEIMAVLLGRRFRPGSRS